VNNAILTPIADGFAVVEQHDVRVDCVRMSQALFAILAATEQEVLDGDLIWGAKIQTFSGNSDVVIVSGKDNQTNETVFARLKVPFDLDSIKKDKEYWESISE